MNPVDWMSDASPAEPMPEAPLSAPGLTQAGRAVEVRPPRPDEALSARAWRDERKIPIEGVALAIIAALALAWVSGACLVADRSQPLGSGTVAAVVERIIAAESNGDPNARNKRSSA